jgi:hypothetical protein
MPSDMRTHDLDWRRHLRQSKCLIVLVTPDWHGNALAQRQYAYARELGKPITLLVQEGTPLPEGADAHPWYVWDTIQELATLVTRIEREWAP